jgi:hypothetical protein
MAPHLDWYGVDLLPSPKTALPDGSPSRAKIGTHDAHRPARIITYWRPQGGLSGPWPPSRGVIRRLPWLSQIYG